MLAKMGKLAIGANQEQISLDLIEASIEGLNPMSSLKQRVELTFQASDLPDLDVGSKTDPFVVLWSLQTGKRVRLGETEVVADTLNPSWIKSIVVDYYFEVQQ